MTTDNVLVNRELFEALKSIAKIYCPYDLRDVLKMPDLIESERDVGVVADKIVKILMDESIGKSELSEPFYDTRAKFKAMAQIIINALRYRKDGE